MKTLVLVFLISFYSGMNGFSQNRIHGWEIDKITSVQVELTAPDDETEILVFKTKQSIGTIISFLKNVDFKEYKGTSVDNEEQLNNWSSKIIFQGQRDQVYLYKNSASIGKTSFLIDNKVIEDFRIILTELINEVQ